MTDWIELRPGAYADSVRLLEISRDLAALPGVAAAQVAMGTPLNLDMLTQMGFDIPAEADPNDLVVALRIDDAEQDSDTVAQTALSALAAALTGRPAGSTAAEEQPPRTTRAALAAGAELALVSVPGPAALVEAMDAVEAGRDVMVFSDNVPVEQEVALKRAAAERGVLVMGPDCGTAVVDGSASPTPPVPARSAWSPPREPAASS